jgi:hypothetical protein
LIGLTGKSLQIPFEQAKELLNGLPSAPVLEMMKAALRRRYGLPRKISLRDFTPPPATAEEIRP